MPPPHYISLARIYGCCFLQFWQQVLEQQQEDHFFQQQLLIGFSHASLPLLQLILRRIPFKPPISFGLDVNFRLGLGLG